MTNDHPKGRRKAVTEGTKAPAAFRCRLRMLVEEIGNQQKAGDIAGVTGEQVGRWINGHAEPKFFGIARIVRAVGRSLDWIAFADNDEESPDRREVARSEIAERTRESSGGESPAALSGRLGIAAITVERALTGEIGSVVEVASAAGWSLDWLLLGRRSGGAVRKEARWKGDEAGKLDLERLVYDAVMEIERHAAERGLKLDPEDRASMTATYFRVLIKNATG